MIYSIANIEYYNEFIKGKKGTEVRLTVKKMDGSTEIIPIIRDVVEIILSIILLLQVRQVLHSM